MTGVPTVNPTFIGGLNDVALHPAFSSNQLVYLSYSKDGERGVTLALARGRFDGRSLTDVRDIFVADAWEAGGGPTGGGGTFGGRILFGPDGLLYMTVGDRDVRVLTDDPLVGFAPRACAATLEKCFGCATTGAYPRTIRSSAERMLCRRSSPTAIAIRTAWRFILKQERCGSASSARWAETS